MQIMGIFKSRIVFELDYAGKYLCLMFVHSYHDFCLDGFFFVVFLSNTWMGVPHKGICTLPSTGHSVVGHLYATFFDVGLTIFCQCNVLPAV